MALIDKETIRAEIERMKQNVLSKVHHYPIHRIELLDDLLAFLDTLPEQPVKGLEEEIERFKEKVGCPLYWCDEKEQSEWVSIIARHFAEWGTEQARKED